MSDDRPSSPTLIGKAQGDDDDDKLLFFFFFFFVKTDVWLRLDFFSSGDCGTACRFSTTLSVIVAQGCVDAAVPSSPDTNTYTCLSLARLCYMFKNLNPNAIAFLSLIWLNNV